MWQTPIRHDHLTGISQASANSRRLPYCEFHGTVRPLRVNETFGPAPMFSEGDAGKRSGARDSGGDRRFSAEYLGVDTGVADTPGLQVRSKVAKGKQAVHRDRSPLPSVPVAVAIRRDSVVRRRHNPYRTHRHLPACCRRRRNDFGKTAQKPSRLSREWVLRAISGTVTPPHFAH